MLVFLIKRPFVIPFALFILCLELLQLWIPGRTSSISDPLWVLLLGWLLPIEGQGIDASGSRDYQSETFALAPKPITPAWRLPLATLAILLPLTAFGIYTIVRLPGVPYNVQELLRDNASFAASTMFVIGALSVGAVAPWIGSFLNSKGYFAAIVWPIALLASGTTTLILLGFAVTPESISDIAGSRNLYYFVTQEKIWGAPAAWLFENVLSRGLVGFFERPIRFSALLAPLTIFLALFCRLGFLSASQHLRLSLLAIPSLLLAKGIAFDGSSTDNLNELIARPGEFGLGGGGYLYALVALIAFLACRLGISRMRDSIFTLVLLLIGVPVSWWLLNQGLEPQVHKYGNIFSGVQFLLGPDREEILPQEILLQRWSLVFTVIVAGLGLSLGVSARIQAFFQGLTNSINNNVTFDSTKDQKKTIHLDSPKLKSIPVHITNEQVYFLHTLAIKIGIKPELHFQRIIEKTLNDQPPSELIKHVTQSLTERGGEVGGGLATLNLHLTKDSERVLHDLAASAKVSPSRAVRRLLEQLMREWQQDKPA
jgi:hypothetical protein